MAGCAVRWAINGGRTNENRTKGETGTCDRKKQIYSCGCTFDVDADEMNRGGDGGGGGGGGGAAGR